MSKSLYGWFNFETEKYDYYEGEPPDLMPYLPNDNARNLFNLYLEEGRETIVAYKDVLMLCVEKVFNA